jgi:hypothetical protein
VLRPVEKIADEPHFGGLENGPGSGKYPEISVLYSDLVLVFKFLKWYLKKLN